MAVIATVDKFGMTFSEAYHKVTRLTYESYDVKEYSYPSPAEPQVDENGETLTIAPTVEWLPKKVCHFDVETYASASTRSEHAEPIYRTHFNFEPSLEAEAADILVQAYAYLKAQAGYEDAVDC